MCFFFFFLIGLLYLPSVKLDLKISLGSLGGILFFLFCFVFSFNIKLKLRKQ